MSRRRRPPGHQLSHKPVPEISGLHEPRLGINIPLKGVGPQKGIGSIVAPKYPLLRGFREIARKCEERRLTQPAVLPMPSFKSGPRKPFAAKHASTLVRPSNVLRGSPVCFLSEDIKLSARRQHAPFCLLNRGRTFLHFGEKERSPLMIYRNSPLPNRRWSHPHLQGLAEMKGGADPSTMGPAIERDHQCASAHLRARPPGCHATPYAPRCPWSIAASSTPPRISSSRILTRRHCWGNLSYVRVS